MQYKGRQVGIVRTVTLWGSKYGNIRLAPGMVGSDHIAVARGLPVWSDGVAPRFIFAHQRAMQLRNPGLTAIRLSTRELAYYRRRRARAWAWLKLVRIRSGGV